MKPPTWRDQRKPRHGWFDYEVLDVFGDELGPFGLTVYMVLARFCYGGFRVKMGVRELAKNARISKSEVARTLKKLIDLGLVAEHPGATPKSVGSYDLMDVKELVEGMRSLVRTAKSVPRRDRSEGALAHEPEEEPAELAHTNDPESSGDAAQATHGNGDGTLQLEAADLSLEQDTNCPPQGQMPSEGQNGQNGHQECPSPGTDVSHGRDSLGTDLSPQRARFNRQEVRSKETTTPPPVLLVEWAKSILAKMAPLGVVDAQTPRRMLDDCLQANPDVTLEEIESWIGYLADRAREPQNKIRDVGAYVIRMVGECVAGGQYAQLQAGSGRRRTNGEAEAHERTPTLAWEAYEPVAPVVADTTWRAIRGALEKHIPRPSFETWIKPTRGLDAIDGKLYVRVPSIEFQHLGEKYGELIQEAIAQQSLTVAEVLFVAAPEELPWPGGTP